MAWALRLAMATVLVAGVGVGLAVWSASPATWLADAQGEPPRAVESPPRAAGTRACSPTGNPRAGSRSPPTPAVVDQGSEGCVALLGPTPVIPEAPLAILIPLTASAVLVGVVWLAHRGGAERHSPAGKEVADGE